jgi:hypothetical protein
VAVALPPDAMFGTAKVRRLGLPNYAHERQSINIDANFDDAGPKTGINGLLVITRTTAEHHDNAAKAHRTAAGHHGKRDHCGEKKRSAIALERSSRSAIVMMAGGPFGSLHDRRNPRRQIPHR